jgi:hypothetical protein
MQHLRGGALTEAFQPKLPRRRQLLGRRDLPRRLFGQIRWPAKPGPQATRPDDNHQSNKGGTHGR